MKKKGYKFVSKYKEVSKIVEMNKDNREERIEREILLSKTEWQNLVADDGLLVETGEYKFEGYSVDGGSWGSGIFMGGGGGGAYINKDGELVGLSNHVRAGSVGDDD